MLPATAEAVLTFLDSVGRRSEAELYLRLFRELPRESFAIVAIEGALARSNGGAIAEQLRFLADLGLFAPVVLGLFEPAFAVAAADRLLRRLGSAGLDAAVYEVPQPDLASALRAELRQGRVPVLYYSGDMGGTDARFAQLGRLGRELGSRKLVLLRQAGGLGSGLERNFELAPGHHLQMNADGISVINLHGDYDALLERRVLTRPDRELLDRVRTLLTSESHASTQVNVAAPLAMLRELFTVRGAGTLIKRGTPVLRVGSYAELDQERLRLLLEASFGRPLVPDFFSHPLLAVYVEPGYRGAAVLEPSPVAPVLSKFAVEPVAQGEGMGRDVWQAFAREVPSFIWRARSNNPICSWYAQQCDGMQRTERWTVFWRGVDPTRVAAVVVEMLGRPEDFQQ